MFHRRQQQVKVILVQWLALLAVAWPSQCLIITSVIAGDKKFKTISFDSKFLKPLMFESELPNTEFRRHRTMRPPKFDIDVNIPIKLPLEDEYPQEEYRKPVVSDIAFETGEIVEKTKSTKKTKKNNNYKAPDYPKPMPAAPKGHHPQQYQQQQQQPKTYRDAEYAAASSTNIQLAQKVAAPPPTQFGAINNPVAGLQPRPRNSVQQVGPIRRAGADMLAPAQTAPISAATNAAAAAAGQQLAASESNLADYRRSAYGGGQAQQYGAQAPKQNHDSYQQDFIPGGFVNLQLSGPTGGPRMTYEDFDREKWAQQLSQTAGAMPYPILNYHQLQNFYGGLGTFTNGLAENRYTHLGPLELLKKSLHQLSSKFHFG